MKILKYIDIQEEIEIDLNSSDIRLILTEEPLDQEPLHNIKRDLHDAFQYMKGIPDSVLEKLGDPVRETLFKAFTEELKRIKPK